jgi:hypothetical protein
MRDPQQGVGLPVSNTGLFMIGATARWIEDYDRYCGQKSRWAYISPGTSLPRCKRWKSSADQPITGSDICVGTGRTSIVAYRATLSRFAGLTTTFERDWSKSAAS